MRRPVLLLFFLLGAWSGGTVFMWQTAIQNFAVAEAVAASGDHGLSATVGDLSNEGLRAALRYQASEVNRLFFRGWGWVQIPLAAGALFLAWITRCGPSATLVTGSMFVIVIVLAAYVVPETVRLGRMIDFAADGDLPSVRSMFWTLHHSYTGLDMLKFALGLGAVGLVCRTTSRSSAKP
jgi:hypothetical protein